MAFWSKKVPTGGKEGVKALNPWRALNPDVFDKGEKINRCADELRRLAVSQTSTESDAIVALQTALGKEIAAHVLRRNPTFLPDQKLHYLDQNARCNMSGSA